jgi:acetyl esterase/lipase
MAQLEPGVQNFVDRLNQTNSPPIYKLSVSEARNALNSLQTQVVYNIPAQIEDIIINGISVRIFRPHYYKSGVLPAVVYIHGGGWILGNKFTHDRLVRQIVNGSNVAIIFIEYTLSPEAQYPVALEQIYYITKYVSENCNKMNLDASRLVVMGDSVGGNMTTVITLLSKYRGSPRIAYQVLAYPVTDSTFNTESYKKFEDGPWLSKKSMEWVFDAYCPNVAIRKDPTISPLNATVEQLSGLPPALIIIDENDVLRDESEAYAHKLMQAGVKVSAIRCLGTIHDFLMLNPIANTNATNTAVELINLNLCKLLHS